MLRSNTQSHLTSRVISFVFACVAVVWLSSAAAQEKPANQERPRRALPAETEAQDIIKIDTDLVPVDVTVTDSKGRLVRNLTKEDFKLFEDGVERPIASFNVEKVEGTPRPVAIVFAIDVSGSMTAEEVERVTDAMREFSRRLAEHPATFALMTFGMHVKTIQSLTSDREKLDRAFEKLSHEPNGMSTHAYDAVDDAVRMLARHAPLTKQHQLVKRAVVVITDGFPVGDVVSPDTVIERANAADTSVYVVTMLSYTRIAHGPDERVGPGEAGHRIVREALDSRSNAIVMPLPHRRPSGRPLNRTLEIVLAKRPCRVIIDSERAYPLVVSKAA